MSTIASSPSALSLPFAAPNKLTGLGRLLWKEYRTLRWFWLAMIGLFALLAAVTLLFSQDKNDSFQMIFNFALGAPAFFAVGAAGASFAAEKEEGTYDFLRAAPISAGQILASKLICVALATVAMFVVLWPVALVISGNRPPLGDALAGMWGLWTVGALKALAWGTLFSLLSVRPLLAVVLAIAAASTCAHGLAWQFRQGTNGGFEWLSYSRSAPWLALLAAAVLGVDVYLGLNWLKAGDQQTGRGLGRFFRTPIRGRGEASPPPTSLAPALSSSAVCEMPAELQRLLIRRSRAAMLGRLLWQQFRQSWRMMLGMLLIGLPSAAMGVGMLQRAIQPIWVNARNYEPEMAIFAAWSTLMGSAVFLGDQERRNYRFFAEHNVPPRYVWFTRHLIWLVPITITLLAFGYLWASSQGGLQEIWHIVKAAMAGGYNTYNNQQWRYISLPPVFLGFACALVAYSAGQWASMFIRSGIMAAFAGLVLAFVLCAWTLLMVWMQFAFWWSVLPLPVVLLFATWLRAPDWISENRRTSARVKAAAVVLVPALALLIWVPVRRVQQVPEVSPGFDVAQVAASLTANAAEGEKTDQLYRDADQDYQPLKLDLGDVVGADRLNDWQRLAMASHRAEIIAELKRKNDIGNEFYNLSELADHYLGDMPPQLTDAELNWLHNNSGVLKLLLQAADRPLGLFYDPAKATAHAAWNPTLNDRQGLILLALTSGRQLQAEGKLDEALQRYLATLRVFADLYTSQDSYVQPEVIVGNFQSVFRQIGNWAGAKGQSPQRIRAALVQLQAFNVDLLRTDLLAESDYLLMRRLLSGDPDLRQAYDGSRAGSEVLWATLMPWENDRALRVLNILTSSWLYRFDQIRFMLAAQAGPGGDAKLRLNSLALTGEYGASYPGFESFDRQHHLDAWPDHDLLATTLPDLTLIDRRYHDMAKLMIAVAAQKRGAMLVLALQAYRLEHGQLPMKLSDLPEEESQVSLIDPYSGLPFRYFPAGIPADASEEPVNPAAVPPIWQNYGVYGPYGFQSIEPNQPGVWCMGPNLEVQVITYNLSDDTSPDVDPDKNIRQWSYVYRSGYEWTHYEWAQNLSLRDVWQRGSWFPLPDAVKK